MAKYCKNYLDIWSHCDSPNITITAAANTNTNTTSNPHYANVTKGKTWENVSNLAAPPLHYYYY